MEQVYISNHPPCYGVIVDPFCFTAFIASKIFFFFVPLYLLTSLTQFILSLKYLRGNKWKCCCLLWNEALWESAYVCCYADTSAERAASNALVSKEAEQA